MGILKQYDINEDWKVWVYSTHIELFNIEGYSIKFDKESCKNLRKFLYKLNLSE